MKVLITAIRIADYKDLQLEYENPIEHACCMKVGMKFICHDGTKPKGLCPEAWKAMEKYVIALLNGEGNFYDGWMKNPYSAMISCDDGFRPVSFYIERIDD